MISIYAEITLILWVFVFAGLVITGRTAQEGVRVRAQRAIGARIFKFAMTIAMFIVIYFPGLFHLHEAPATRNPISGGAGVALCAAGLLVLIAARRALGKNWSDLVVLKEGHQVVQSGPYRWVRHPLYSGMLLALLGSALAVGTRAAYVITACCFLGLFIKSRREEGLLSKELPSYAEYRRHVKGFVPHVF